MKHTEGQREREKERPRSSGRKRKKWGDMVGECGEAKSASVMEINGECDKLWSRKRGGEGREWMGEAMASMLPCWFPEDMGGDRWKRLIWFWLCCYIQFLFLFSHLTVSRRLSAEVLFLLRVKGRRVIAVVFMGEGFVLLREKWPQTRWTCSSISLVHHPESRVQSLCFYDSANVCAIPLREWSCWPFGVRREDISTALQKCV